VSSAALGFSSTQCSFGILEQRHDEKHCAPLRREEKEHQYQSQFSDWRKPQEKRRIQDIQHIQTQLSLAFPPALDSF
jgi:hypothetical protein